MGVNGFQVLFDCYMAIDERKWVANEHITDMPELAEEKVLYNNFSLLLIVYYSEHIIL